MISSYLWLHWCEVDLVGGEIYYRMEAMESSHPHKLQDVAETRKSLHNYVDYVTPEVYQGGAGPIMAEPASETGKL
jgi:hypothetical protein